MSDLFLIHSDNQNLRDRILKKVDQEFRSILPEGLIDQMDGSDWSIISCRNQFVPYEAISDSQRAAMVIGSMYSPDPFVITDLINPSSSERMKEMKRSSRNLNFGMVLSIANGEVLITTDWLGLYPLYYFGTSSTFIVTSIPNLIRFHHEFRPIIDINGIISILLLAHTSLGYTLLQGVTRLKSGHILKYKSRKGFILEEVTLGGASTVPKNMDEAVEAFDSSFSKVMGATTLTSRSVYLSGGLDSRIVAGYMDQFCHGEMKAITMGSPSDIEMIAASRVVGVIGAEHERIPINHGDNAVYAQRSIDQDTMCSGLYTLNEWSFSETPHEPIHTGFLGDPVMGALHVEWGRESLCDLFTFNAALNSANEIGISQGIIRELVRSNNIDDKIHDFITQLRDEYYSYPGEPWQRSWWFDLQHRQRFLIGRLPKIIALRSWPILPYTYPEMIRLTAATPYSILSYRKVQIELIRRKFPKLARLPFARDIDRKFYSITPRKRKTWPPILGRIKNSLEWHYYNKFIRPERLVFARTFDFNGPGWKILRDKARALADETDFILNKDIVLQLIPDSLTEINLKRPISYAAGRKALLGIVLCVYQYFMKEQ